jgi:hypothetical protein
VSIRIISHAIILVQITLYIPPTSNIMIIQENKAKLMEDKYSKQNIAGDWLHCHMAIIVGRRLIPKSSVH